MRETGLQRPLGIYLDSRYTLRIVTSLHTGLDVHVVNTTRLMTSEHMHARTRNLSRKEKWTSHTAVVMDQSGSMRKTDVPGGTA
jgi:hypothetical protein